MRYKAINEYGRLFRDIPLEISKNMSDYDEFDLFLQIPDLKKIDILEALEELALSLLYQYKDIDDAPFGSYYFDLWGGLNQEQSSYADDYIAIIGQLFLAGYIDFLCDWDDDRDKIDYPTNLSYYKEDKYQAWIYFRDNFFYKERFLRKYDNNYNEIIKVSWDTPKYWSEYNILVARTPKGDKYFNEILAPRFYNKYKDLEVEIDSKGNVVRWIGEINR